METRPHIKKTNLFYGGMKIHGTNIFFSNGSEDPWQFASVLKLSADGKQKGMKTGYIECEDCGHCMDFQTPTESQPKQLTKVQNDIAAEVARWLKAAKDKRQRILDKEQAKEEIKKALPEGMKNTVEDMIKSEEIPIAKFWPWGNPIKSAYEFGSDLFTQ